MYLPQIIINIVVVPDSLEKYFVLQVLFCVLFNSVVILISSSSGIGTKTFNGFRAPCARYLPVRLSRSRFTLHPLVAKRALTTCAAQESVTYELRQPQSAAAVYIRLH